MISRGGDSFSLKGYFTQASQLDLEELGNLIASRGLDPSALFPSMQRGRPTRQVSAARANYENKRFWNDLFEGTRNQIRPTSGVGSAVLQSPIYKDIHQMSMDIHKILMANIPVGGSSNMMAAQWRNMVGGTPNLTHATAWQNMWFGGAPRGGAGSPPGSPPPPGSPSPRGGFPPPGGPPNGPLGNGARFLRGLFHGYGLLRGMLLGEIGTEAVGDVLNPSRLAAEAYRKLLFGIGPYEDVAEPAYALATAGGFSGADFLGSFAPLAKGKTLAPKWMSKYGITAPEIVNDLLQLGIAPRNEAEAEAMAKNLPMATRLPGFAGLPKSIPIGLARQAAALGIASPEEATDSYLKKLSIYGAEWTQHGIDRATIFKAIQSNLDVIAKSSATSIDNNSVVKLLNQLALSSLPGGRNGQLGSQMISGAQAAEGALGTDPFRTSLLGFAIQKYGGFNATSIQKLLGPNVMKLIGGAQGHQFQDIIKEIQLGDFPGAAALIGLALQSDSSGVRYNQLMRGVLAGVMGLPPGETALGLHALSNLSLSIGMGYGGTSNILRSHRQTNFENKLQKLDPNNPGDVAAAAIIAWRESKDRSIKNSQYQVWGYKNGVPIGKTASGFFQILASNWRKFGQGIVDFNQFPEAYMAPLSVQYQVFKRMYDELGYAPWDAAHGGSITSDVEFHRELNQRLTEDRYSQWASRWKAKPPPPGMYGGEFGYSYSAPTSRAAGGVGAIQPSPGASIVSNANATAISAAYTNLLNYGPALTNAVSGVIAFSNAVATATKKLNNFNMQFNYNMGTPPL